LFTRTELNSTGASGDLSINTQLLEVQDGAEVTVASLGTGNAGNLTIDTDSINLDNGTLTADTRSVNTNPNQLQATINLRANDLIFLRRGSKITTNAIGNNVIGGDIKIDTNFLIAAENSDISANSTDFRGGRVTVKALSILGTQFRNALTLESDITATGASSDLSGTVELNTPDVDPSKGLVELPVNIVDAQEQIAQGCSFRGEQIGSFVVTGRGGLSDSPNEMLTDDAIEVNLVTLDPKVNRSSRNVSAIAPAPIVEAQGWIIGKNGKVLLVASAPTVTPTHPGLTPESCKSPAHRGQERENKAIAFP
jgi:large exoprotein involved in heme utilization and adhesion